MSILIRMLNSTRMNEITRWLRTHEQGGLHKRQDDA